MLKKSISKRGVFLLLSILLNVSFFVQAQENNNQKAEVIQITEVVDYEEFVRMHDAGLIHPPTEEELRQAQLKAKETSENQYDSIKIVEDDADIEEDILASTEDQVEWVDLDEIDYVEVEPEPEEEIFMVVEESPEFPGGVQALLEYLRKNIKYPQICRENGVQGRVIVSFIVDKDGSVVEPKIVAGVHPQLDAEAIRIVSIMPKWKPGSQRGKPVRVAYTMPLTFSLGEYDFNGGYSANQINQSGDMIIGNNFTVLSKDKYATRNKPQVVKDPSDKNNKCLLVPVGKLESNPYNAQLFIISNAILSKGDIVTLTMKVKASKPQISSTEAHSVPGTHLYNSPCDDVDFTTDWTDYKSTFCVASTNFRCIAIDLATLKSGNKCYFDDIRITVEKDAVNNNSTLADGVSNQPASQKSAFDKGMDFLLGSKEQVQDFQQAYDNFSIAAQEGNADAVCMIGYMYEKGYAVSQDFGQALEWYKKAAEKNHAGAQNSLGRMYANGYGVERDKEQALFWYRKAAANGNKQAKNSIAQLENETGSKTIALIIGNADYPQGRLANPVNDAQDLAVKLKGLGFEVIGKTNLDLEDMIKTIDDFCKRASEYDAAMFFYAGHAVQNGGVNYLMPAKSTINAAAINDECVNMNQVMVKLNASDVKTKIIILDACRDNGLQSLSRSASEQGLARMSSSGSIIMFSTQAGKTAKDGTGNRNSPFTQELLKEIDKPNVPLHQMFKDIQINVSNNTNKEQVPSINDDLIGTFYFNLKY